MELDVKQILTAIGLMSGTSMDGIDVALIRSDGMHILEHGPRFAYPYDAACKSRIEMGLIAVAGWTKADTCQPTLAELEHELTLRHAVAIDQFLAEYGIKNSAIDLIGFHGQTVLHRPNLGFTIQLGSGQLLADLCGLPVVHDLRSNDIAHGGQGAPLVPIYHQVLAQNLSASFRARSPIAFVNIGGISNVTYIGKNGLLIAFDAGPGNVLIDQWVQTVAGRPYDDNGRIASMGIVVPEIVERYLTDPFFDRSIPKSLDRNDFTKLQVPDASLEDGARSLARVSAAAIMRACEHLPSSPDLWIVCGGGRRNPHIVSDLRELARHLNGGEVIVSEVAGLDGGAIEAEAWAYLAIRSIKQLPLTFPTTTGCRQAVTGGVVAYPCPRLPRSPST
jgi:anhydro-N-acetylmuramic acid kinase